MHKYASSHRQVVIGPYVNILVQKLVIRHRHCFIASEMQMPMYMLLYSKLFP